MNNAALDLKYMSYDRRQCIIVFHIQKLLKASRTGVSLPAIVLKRYEKPELCVVKTLFLQPDRKAAEAAAPRNECALKILLLIPDNSNTDLSHRAKVDVVTSS
jgi:hypothetical protein